METQNCLTTTQEKENDNRVKQINNKTEDRKREIKSEGGRGAPRDKEKKVVREKKRKERRQRQGDGGAMGNPFFNLKEPFIAPLSTLNKKKKKRYKDKGQYNQIYQITDIMNLLPIQVY